MRAQPMSTCGKRYWWVEEAGKSSRRHRFRAARGVLGMDQRRFLVKGSLPPGQPFAIGAVQFVSQPLFRSIDRPTVPGAAPGDTWHIVSALSADGINDWDVCHALVAGGPAIAGGVRFAEPDIAHSMVVGPEADAPHADAPCQADPQNDKFPRESDNFWFHDSAHCDISGLGTGSGVRIAHLDTGYDPHHDNRPHSVHFERNLVENNNDATDAGTTGPLTNPGHGVGTIGLLAGAPVNGVRLGMAPAADVVPVRIATSVVLFYTSTVAQAMDYVHELCRNGPTAVDVVTMSMGGVASQAWADAVNALYEAGVFVVTAAGNNQGNLPSRFIVFPARFRRVVAACGIMADQRPYTDLGLGRMAGNYGPSSKMDTALAAYTPNVPWARRGCAGIVNWNGAGTSSATPQIAGAAALYAEAHASALARYPERWMRVEAIRDALFRTADNRDRTHLGQGVVRPAMAVGVAPPAAVDPSRKQPPDDARWALLRVLTGVGIAADDARSAMLELEALQLSQSAEVEKLLPESGAPLTSQQAHAIADAIAARPGASQHLRDALSQTSARVFPSAAVASAAAAVGATGAALHRAVPQPLRRRLQIYAFDPQLESQIGTAGYSEAVVDVRWEPLAPGPVGAYVEVVDIDPASALVYAPVELDRVELVAGDGLRPAEGEPQFHQQMVYAVAMRAIEHFERALGRVALWAPRIISNGRDGTPYKEDYVERLRIYPHALRDANAYYSPDKKALLFGYFPAMVDGEVARGQVVFSCLSSDIVAHETAHALLDGLHRHYIEPTNPDQTAFHEAFADMVALFHHFTIPQALRAQIAAQRGDLEARSLLAEIAYQFGAATAGHGALRNAIGTPPCRTDYSSADEPHARGLVLVSAVFDAFVQVYTERCADLFRLASAGTGILPPGAIPSDLADRLAEEASKLAARWLVMIVRSLDYCPPVDITFGDFLRALLTSDRDAAPEDPLHFRIALASAFQARGISAEGVRYGSPGSLYWDAAPDAVAGLALPLSQFDMHWDLNTDRRRAYDLSRTNARRLHDFVIQQPPEVLSEFGVQQPGPATLEDLPGMLHGIEIHSVRPASRVVEGAGTLQQLIVGITQAWTAGADSPDGAVTAGDVLYSGATLVVDLRSERISYLVRKRLKHAIEFRRSLHDSAGAASLRGNYTNHPIGEPFALVHAQYRSMGPVA